ncbi:MAG: type II toxin-antitoxin system RelE/ParE family toxin [Acidobacteriaceae bacterium]
MVQWCRLSNVGDDKKLTVAFYRSRSGAEPVRDWLKGLPTEDRHTLGRDLRLIEMGWPIGMPLCRALGGGLWEVRSTLAGNRIARVLFCAVEGHMVLLHGFIKKRQKTPDAELNIAHKRKKDLDL